MPADGAEHGPIADAACWHTLLDVPRVAFCEPTGCPSSRVSVDVPVYVQKRIDPPAEQGNDPPSPLHVPVQKWL